MKRVSGIMAGLLAALVCAGSAGCVGGVESYGEPSLVSEESADVLGGEEFPDDLGGETEAALGVTSESGAGSRDASDTESEGGEVNGASGEAVSASGESGNGSSEESAAVPSPTDAPPSTSDTRNGAQNAGTPSAPATQGSTAQSPTAQSPTAATQSTKPAATAATQAGTSAKPAESADKPVDKSGVSFSWSAGSTWEEGGNVCGTCELTIKNDSDAEVGGWKVTFDVPEGFKITNSWSGSFGVSGTTASVTNAEYNGNIPVGGSVNFGFNYSSPTKFTPPDTVGFNGTRASAPSGGNGGNSGNNQNNGNSGGNRNDQQSPAPSGDVKTLLERSPDAKQGDDWLHTDGNRILDKNGRQVWLTGVNWFGYNTGTNTFDGLWNSNMRASVKGIADHGFNLIRVPISAELLNQWSRGEYPRANYNNAMNTELNDMNSLEIFDYFLKLAEENGVKVMPDIHCAETDAMGHNVNLWYTARVTEEDYYHALEWLAERYKDNDTIIAIDIKNEPHGKPHEGEKAIWNGSKDKNNWKNTAEVAAKRILAKNPNVLIMVEGTEIYSKKNGDYSSTNSADYYFNWWGGNLRGVRDYPVDLGKYRDKLVYSPHDYGPTVYEQPWFKGGYDYDSLIKDCWQDNWLYIHKDGTAPLLIGEWGGFMREPNLTWMTCMRRLIKEYHLNHTFWCYNANSGDTGGLVLDDFTTWDTEKYNFVKEVLWQENGKFVGLDHEIPLGENGISLSEAKGIN